MDDLDFELSGTYGEAVTVKLGDNVAATVPTGAILEKMARVTGRTTSVVLDQGKEIKVYQGAQECWSSSDCQLELDGLSGVRLNRAQALNLARVLLAFSATGEPLRAKHDARDWVIRLERTSAL